MYKIVPKVNALEENIKAFAGCKQGNWKMKII